MISVIDRDEIGKLLLIVNFTKPGVCIFVITRKLDKNNFGLSRKFT